MKKALLILAVAFTALQVGQPVQAFWGGPTNYAGFYGHSPAFFANGYGDCNRHRCHRHHHRRGY